jgi:transposase
LPDPYEAGPLERVLFPAGAARAPALHLGPDWAPVHHALKRQGVTVFLRGQDSQAATPDGRPYSWFCHTYRAWTQNLDLVMRQPHRAGEKLLVDDARPGIPVVHGHSGAGQAVALCVVVPGASNATDAEAPWTQSLPDWIGAHVRTLAAFGGVPETVVPDNRQAAVTRPHRYEPERHRTYAARAQHYGFAVMPARAAKPRDKAKGEGGVPGVARWIVARLRPHPCFALGEGHTALHPRGSALHARPVKKLPGSRQQLFAALDRPALRPFPAQPYDYAEWKQARGKIDDHVAVEGQDDSVPSVLVRQQLDVRLRAQGVALFHKGKRVARHRRSPLKGRHSTVAAHMPTAHHRSAAWTPQRLMHWAAQSGPATAQGVETIRASRPHPQRARSAPVAATARRHGWPGPREHPWSP